MHWGMGFLPLFPLLWVGLIVLFAWAVSRRFGWRYRRGANTAQFEANALEILRRRYARGEIDGTTFDLMRERLEGSARPHD